MHTEKQASELWCPMVRSMADGLAGDNTFVVQGVVERNPEYSRCIASQCAMWRWDHIPIRKRIKTNRLVCSEEEAGGRPEHVPEDWLFEPADKGDDWSGWVEPQESSDARRTGFCGLAKP